MVDLGWRESIIQVLHNESEPLHYTDIAEQIAAKKLRKKIGATPANTVNAQISLSLSQEKDGSPFMRVGRGYYALRERVTFGFPLANQNIETGYVENLETDTRLEETGLINAFGMYWRRTNVLWKGNPRILGQQQLGSDSVDFSGQQGVYLLHDTREVVYVGRTTGQTLGKRLFDHTLDRLNGRWDRFSWFGVYKVKENGILENGESANFNLVSLIITMEALLIEGLEPRQNRKRGDDFKAIEFLQVEDPDIIKVRQKALLDEMKSKLS